MTWIAMLSRSGEEPLCHFMVTLLLVAMKVQNVV
jgi:hypothetical protein